ncbi:class I SAM-dependent methyltransferase [Streptomyces sp. NPDC020917]|uniref:class I SAM-dependent methyltransferase n=1 Tax=Streptomyces sp. NPDC020917 TaxID=3365102 RepID=UPI0037A5FA9A
MSVPLTAPLPAPAWSTADPYAEALRSGRGPLFLACADAGQDGSPDADARLLPLEVERWCGAPDAADRTVLALAASAPPVLDIGCGPGRMVTALATRGAPALGIDVNPHAVLRTRAAGGQALVRSVFDSLPREGSWRTALLMDGNVGIGGDPVALLARVRDLVCPGGTLVAECTPGGSGPDQDERLQVRLHDGTAASGIPFPWALLGTNTLARHAAAAGWTAAASWSMDGRGFTALRAPHCG